MEQRVAQLEQALRDMNTALQQSQQQLQTAQAQAAQATQAAQTAQQEAAQANNLQAILQRQTQLMERMAGTGKPELVDSRGLGRPPVFHGGAKEFKTWIVKTRSFLSGIFPQAAAMLEWCEMQPTEITEETIRAQFETEIPEWQEFNQQLQTVLIQLTDREALQIIINTRAGGLESWRKLHKRFDPATGNRRRAILTTILKMARVDMHHVTQSIERLEELLQRFRDCRDESGVGQSLPEGVVIAVVEGIVPAVLEQHLQLNRGRLKTYAQVKEEVITFVETRLTDPAAGGSEVTPMDVGAIGYGKSGKKGKGKGDRPGKGKVHPHPHRDLGQGQGKNGSTSWRRGPQGSSSTSSTPTTFQGYCHNCQRWGHRASECWRPKAGAGHAAKGKGKSRKTVGSLEENTAEVGTNEERSRQRPPQQASGSSTGALGTLTICSLDGPVCDDECERESSPQPTQSLSLSAFGAWPENGEYFESYGFKRVHCNLDTGAAVTAIPSDLISCSGLMPSKATYSTASGEPLADLGGVRLHGFNAENAACSIDGRVTRVKKMLVSAAKSVEKGNCVLLTPHGSVLVHSPSAERMDRLLGIARESAHTPLRTVNGTYCFEFWIDSSKSVPIEEIGGDEPRNEKGEMDLAPFHRQGRDP